MGTPAFPTLTASRPVVFYPAEQTDQWDPIADEMTSGHVATRARWTKPRRRLRWVCDVLDETDKDIVMGFLYDRQVKGNEPFYIDNEISNIYPPYDVPDLDETAGGALAQRTYYVKYAWSDGTNKTTPSQEGSQLVAANKYLTVDVITFPSGATEALLYIGTASGSVYYSGKITTSDTTWTEDSASTTVDDTSAAAQKVLYVAATTGMQVGGVLLINSGGAREETGIIASIDTGVSVTLVANLTYEHTLAQADVVETVIGNSAQDEPETTNALKENMYVLLMGNPKLVRNRPVNTWSLEFDLMQVWV